jgi:hypothetical protein
MMHALAQMGELSSTGLLGCSTETFDRTQQVTAVKGVGRTTRETSPIRVFQVPPNVAPSASSASSSDSPVADAAS